MPLYVACNTQISDNQMYSNGDNHNQKIHFGAMSSDKHIQNVDLGKYRQTPGVCVCGGVYSDIFYTYIGSGHFLGFKVLKFSIFGGFQKNKYFWGV